MSGSYVQGSSFHDTMRGAVGLGKTSYLTIKDNVAFNCSGSIFTVAALGVAEVCSLETLPPLALM